MQNIYNKQHHISLNLCLAKVRNVAHKTLEQKCLASPNDCVVVVELQHHYAITTMKERVALSMPQMMVGNNFLSNLCSQKYDDPTYKVTSNWISHSWQNDQNSQSMLLKMDQLSSCMKQYTHVLPSIH